MNSPGNQPVSTWIGEFILLAALWGASFLFTRLGAAEFGALPTAGMRVALASLFLLPVFLVPGVWNDFRQRARHILFVGLPIAWVSRRMLGASAG